MTQLSNSYDDEWRPIADGVFLAQLFNDAQCTSILKAIRSQPDGDTLRPNPPNSMQEYGWVLDDPELAGNIAKLANEQLREEIRCLFPNFPHYELSEHHAFLTSYGEDANQGLSLHVDASHLTLNICLDSDVDGTDLVFTGARCRKHVDEAPDKHPVSVRLRQGDAL